MTSLRPLLPCLPLLLLSTCTEPAAFPEPAWIGPVLSATEPAQCIPHSAFQQLDLVPTSLVQLNDSLLAVVDLGHRLLTVATLAGVVVSRVELTPHGPTGVVDPRSVALEGDSVLVFADGPRGSLRRLTLDGVDAGTVSLGFPPESIVNTPWGFLISILALDPGAVALTFRVDSGGVSGLGIPVRAHPDWRIRALSNAVELVAYPDGRAIVAHRYLIPRAYLLTPVEPGSGTLQWTEVEIPLPQEAGRWAGSLPTGPLEEGGEWLTPVLAGAADPESGDFLYLTRSGRDATGHSEKVILRVDRGFGFLRGHRLPMNAGFMAFDPREQAAVVVDHEANWYRCLTP